MYRAVWLFCAQLCVLCVAQTCTEAINGGTAAQRASTDPAVKRAVRAAVCAAGCFPTASTRMGVEAARLYCANDVGTDPSIGGVWGIVAPKEEGNSELSVTGLGETIYSMGGYPSSRISVRTVELYTLATNTWRRLTDLPRPLNHAMSATVGGKVYIIGGQETASGDYVDSVYEYDPLRDSWLEKASRRLAFANETIFDNETTEETTWEGKSRLPTLRSAGDAAVIGNLIYVAGGREVSTGADFAVYDVTRDAWTTLPPIPQQRNHIVVEALNGRVFVVGGRLGGGFTTPQTMLVHEYNPATRVWRTVAPFPRTSLGGECCSGMNGIAFRGCLHVFGGENGVGVFPEHYSYNPTTNVWTRWTNMPVPVHGIQGAAVIGNWIYLPGGGTSNGGSSGQRIHQVYFPGTLSC